MELREPLHRPCFSLDSLAFQGWVDVDVSEKGAQEAVNAGKLMRDANISGAAECFELTWKGLDLAFTSYQKRAIKTLNLALEELLKGLMCLEKARRNWTSSGSQSLRAGN